MGIYRGSSVGLSFCNSVDNYLLGGVMSRYSMHTWDRAISKANFLFSWSLHSSGQFKKTLKYNFGLKVWLSGRTLA